MRKMLTNKEIYAERAMLIDAYKTKGWTTKELGKLFNVHFSRIIRAKHG